MQRPDPADPHRPRYHFLPLANWMNDPNGLIHWQGRYHLFYQHNPNGAFWGTMHWGHAVSSDLVRWEHLPIALTPTPASPDADGCWSGCAVDHDGVATLIYSGACGLYQLPCVATALDDDLIAWQKYAGNPVIAAPPADLDIIEFRDHAVWREGDLWYQVIGAGIRDVGGTALLYRSPDLRTWEYLHPLCVGDLHATEPVWTGSMWECPQFLDLGARHALIVSAWHEGRTLYTVCLTGDYRDQRFQPESVRKFDLGDNYFYAPQACVDAGGRTVLWGWLQEGRSDQAQRDAGWSGVMSLPRIVAARPDGLLQVTPAPELEVLRGQLQRLAELELTSAWHTLPMQGASLELIAEIVPGTASRIELALRCSPDHAEQTVLRYDRERGWLEIDSTQASLDATTEHDRRGGPFTLPEGESLRLHVFLDHSVIEVFANEQVCITGRVYPSRADSVGIALAAHGGGAQVNRLDVWELRSIWL